MLGSNIKIHFAGMEGIPSFIAKEIAEVNYTLWSCFKFIENKKPDSDMTYKGKWFIPKLAEETSKHVIMDSGLFTMMFGAGKDVEQSMETIQLWQDKQIEFVKQNDIKSTCVECDCQKVLGVEQAWYFRERMRDKLNNRQINVYHKEDGKKGLDRLIEFSDYIAFSVPELRKVYGSDHRKVCRMLVEYTKNRKPEIDIHLLGCTDKKMLHQNKDCTSADSTSWLYATSYGKIMGKRLATLSDATIMHLEKKYRPKIEEMKKQFDVPPVEETGEIHYMNAVFGALAEKRFYENICGSQD